jgi:hypothetical protein
MNLPDLVTFHGARFFYEVTNLESSTPLSDRSKFKKNEEIASTLAWRCPKLRRLDHWEPGKVVILLRKDSETVKHGDTVKYEVRRVKS